jgi:hypothetical protein
MEEEDHFTQTLLPLLSHITAHGSRVAALSSYSSFSIVLFFSVLHSLHHVAALVATTMAALLCSSVSLSWLFLCLFIDKNGATSSISFSTMVVALMDDAVH